MCYTYNMENKLNKNWCICNNTGCIFIRASDFNYTDIEDFAFSCPICNEDNNKISSKTLINIILNAKKNHRKLLKFRLNSYQMVCLSESMVLNFIEFDDNKIHGIPIEIDNNVKTIQYDYI